MTRADKLRHDTLERIKFSLRDLKSSVLNFRTVINTVALLKKTHNEIAFGIGVLRSVSFRYPKTLRWVSKLLFHNLKT
jgi:hypothetical protein